jgi:hypothetical protein
MKVQSLVLCAFSVGIGDRDGWKGFRQRQMIGSDFVWRRRKEKVKVELVGLRRIGVGEEKQLNSCVSEN